MYTYMPYYNSNRIILCCCEGHAKGPTLFGTGLCFLLLVIYRLQYSFSNILVQ